MSTLPTRDDLDSIAPALERLIEESHTDRNGHMNVRHFFNLHIEASAASMAGLGIDDHYISGRRLGFFTAEHHLRYISEVKAGEHVSVRVLFLGRTNKALHNMGFLVNESTGALSNIFEVITVHIDQSTRRAADIPDDVLARIDSHVAFSKDLGWMPPLGGALGLRTSLAT